MTSTFDLHSLFTRCDQDKKKEPAYGTDILRLWSATVEYGKDMPLGSTVLSHTAEVMRKIRNSARFILGNIGDLQSRAQFQRVSKAEMGLVRFRVDKPLEKVLTDVTPKAERYVMHELFKLERVALEGYDSFNFPQGS